MSRMKHLLRKLHIGGSVDDHHRLGDNRQNSPSPSASSSSSSATATATASVRSRTAETGPPAELQRTGASGAAVPSASSVDSSVDFNFFEEEFQVQLALAISVSDCDAREDPESAQIKAAKRISLGCSPSTGETLVEFLSLRYWNYNVVNYDEKVMDGFYDVYGIITNPKLQGQLPSLVDLQAISLSDNVDYEVVLVNRTVDSRLQQLESKAVSIASKCAGELGLGVIVLAQKIADLVVVNMGGPVGDADEMLRRWTLRSYELRTALNTIILPLGCLEVGLSRHRALLFKVLADRINLPCRLVKGSYYTGTDEGAVNIIKIDEEREYIIDLMGAPGTLIPVEIPSSHLQNSGHNSTIAQTVKDLCVALDKKVNCEFERSSARLEGSQGPNPDLELVGSGSGNASRSSMQQEGDDMSHSDRNQTARFEHEFGKLLPLLGSPQGGLLGTEEASSSAQQMKVKDVSKYVISAAQNPEFAQKLHAVLLESGAAPPPDLFADINPPQQLVEQKMQGQSYITEGRKINHECEPCQDKLLDLDLSVVPFLGVKTINAGRQNKKEHVADDLMQKQSRVANISDSSLGYQKTSQNSSSVEQSVLSNTDLHLPVNANAISPGLLPTSEWLMGQADSVAAAGNVPVHGSSVMVSRVLFGERIEVPIIPCAADLCQKQPGNVFAASGAQCFQPNAGKNLKYVEARGNVSSQVGQENINESMAKSIGQASGNPHNSSSNERRNPVLDDVAEWEIPWEDLQIGERIGLGSYGEVYHADWNGTEVAVKKFLDQDFSGDALEQFKCEVRIMLRLRHPNVVLFMGAVTRPPNLSILTEFLPRGSLYRLLHRSNFQPDEKRRLRMALDVAKGMNYLHTSHPTIVHRDLKSPNLLVDKNWVVKVCDFGLSRLKHHTFLSSKSTAGTPEWMAPEVLRNEQANEKCDVYSFGVILWELVTLRIPWSGMNPMQVVGAVGFQNRRLDIPREIDPMVAQIICDCWQSDPNLRPSFAQLMALLKNLKRLAVEVT